MMSEQQQELEETLCTLAMMRQQEEKGYRAAACLPARSRHENARPSRCADVDFRNEMVAWLYQMADLLNYDRETVSIAASHLDRFVMTPSGACAVGDRHRYQLAAITCLYIAAKLNERIALDPKFIISSLLPTSPICYTTVEQIEAMEVTILTALQWRVNPPTSLDFVRQFFKLIPHHLFLSSFDQDDLREEVYEMAKDQTELAVADYRFVSVQASTVAFCSFLNALHSVCLDDQVLQYVSFVLGQALGIDSATNGSSSDFTTVAQVRNSLYEAVMNQPVGVMNQPVGGMIDDTSFAQATEEEDYGAAAVVPLPLLMEEDVMQQDVDVCQRILQSHQTSPRSSIIFP